MAKIKYEELHEFILLMESFSRSNSEFKKKFTTKNKINDFFPEDYVESTILKGIFKVKKVNKNNNLVLVESIQEPDQAVEIKPKFLKKFKNDKKWANILYT